MYVFHYLCSAAYERTVCVNHNKHPSKMCHNQNLSCPDSHPTECLAVSPPPSPPHSSPPLHSPPIQVSEHFQDFDPLRSGSISCSRFRQGLTAIGQPSLSHAEFTALCDAFRDPRKKDHVLWKEFLARVDRGGACVGGCGCGCVHLPEALYVCMYVCMYVCTLFPHPMALTTSPISLPPHPSG